MKTKVILELGCNHNGSMDNARRMIDDAAEMGVWGVKLQKRDVDSIPAEYAKQPRDHATSFGETYLEHRKALELSVEEVEELYLYAEKLGLCFGVSVFDEPSLRLMARLPLDFIKLPSQLYEDRKLNKMLHTLPEHGPMTMVSTGMRTVTEAFNVDHFGTHDVTFYCRSLYPCPLELVNVAAMKKLFERLHGCGSIPGYSSHEVGGEIIAPAVLLGAQYVERHYTLDKTMKGFDHGTVSSDKADMRRILLGIEQSEAILDQPDELSPGELKIRKQYMGY